MTTAPEKPRRLHDLDALRGFAMLLGIALHAALAFIPGFYQLFVRYTPIGTMLNGKRTRPSDVSVRA